MESALEEDKENILELIQELKQPKKLRFIDGNKYYVIYRRMRTFTSFVLTPYLIRRISNNLVHKLVVSDTCSYIIFENELKAYYYSAILNYLVYKVIEKRGVFERDQFIRPLIAILRAGLEWKEEGWQHKVADLGKGLHQEVPKCFTNYIKRGRYVKSCFNRLQTCDESKELFEALINIVDENVDEKRLDESLEQVCRLKR